MEAKTKKKVKAKEGVKNIKTKTKNTAAGPLDAESASSSGATSPFMNKDLRKRIPRKTPRPKSLRLQAKERAIAMGLDPASLNDRYQPSGEYRPQEEEEERDPDYEEQMRLRSKYERAYDYLCHVGEAKE